MMLRTRCGDSTDWENNNIHHSRGQPSRMGYLGERILDKMEKRHSYALVT